MGLNVMVLFSLTGFTFVGAADVQWSHRDEAGWPGQCHVGKEQSPIDIRPQETLPDPFGAHIRGPLVYRGYSNVKVTASNTGYKVRWAAVPGEPAPVLSGGPLRANYSFAEVHFHWLSEHTINGMKYPLEIHMVHLKHGLTFNEAILQRDGVAVVGVLAQVASRSESNALEQFLPAVDSILEKTAGESSPFSVDLTRLFSPNPQAFYTYHGSLTVPLCPEVVTWIVMDKPTTVKHQDYKNLTRANLSGINNDRSVQPLGQRLVYRSTSVSAACSPLGSPSLLGSVALMVSCFGSRLSSTLHSGVNRLVDAKKKFFGKTKKVDKY